MTKVRKRGARGPGGPARARGRWGGAPARLLRRPGSSAPRTTARGAQVSGCGRPRPAPARPGRLDLPSSSAEVPGAPAAGPGGRAAECARRLAEPRPPARACLCVSGSGRMTPRRFCFPVRVPFSSPTLAFSGADRCPGSPEKTTCLFQNKRVPRRPAAASPCPFTRRLQKWRLCPDPNQVTIGRQVCPWGLDCKAKGDVVCAGDFPTHGPFRAACWAQHGRAGDSEARVTVVAAARKPTKPRAGCWRLGLVG